MKLFSHHVEERRERYSPAPFVAVAKDVVRGMLDLDRASTKVERLHRVDDQEFYQFLDKNGITDDIHLFNAKLREWEDYYNYHRPHGALDGQTPYERLVAKIRAGASPAS